MKIGLDIGDNYIKVARLSLEGFPMMVQDGFTKLNHTLNCLEKVENGFLIGYESVTSQKSIAITFAKATGNLPIFTDMSGVVWVIETLLALLLKKIKTDIDTMGIESAIFAVPVGLNETQKNVIHAATKLADINHVVLVDAPLAAIAHHKIQQLNNVLVIDWGYSGVKLAIVTKRVNTYQIERSLDILDIGGQSFTNKLTTIIEGNFEKRFGYALPNLRNNPLKVAEELKIELSANEYASRDIVIDSELINITVSRTTFTEAIKPDVDRGIDAIQQFIDSLTIEAVILTGGCMLIPDVKKCLKTTLSSIKKWYDTEPLAAATMGAAVFNITGTEYKTGTPHAQFLEQKNTVKNTAVNGLI
jgi:molecular chaperone DnaK (HSP70)